MKTAALQYFKRELGFKEALSIVVGRIIGSGIFRTPGPIMIAAAGLEINKDYQLHEIAMGEVSIGFFFAAWVIGGLSTLLSAFCYAELVSFMPRSGGPYAYLKAAYPEVVTFLRGWAMFFVSETASIVAVALVFADYAYFIIEKSSLNGMISKEVFNFCVSFIVIWFLSISNCFGVRFSGTFQNILSSLKILALMLMASTIFFTETSSASYTSLPWWPDQINFAHFIALGEAMRFAFFAYSGWEGATYVAEEVKNPSRNLPRSLFWGIVSVMVVYLLVNAAYLSGLSPQEIIVSKKQVAANYMEKSLGAIGGILLAAMVMISTFGNVGAQIMVKSRTWYAMSRDRLFPHIFGSLHSTYKTPNQAILLQAGWATCLLIYAYLSSNAYESLIDLFSFTSAAFNILTIVSVIILRKKIPLEVRETQAFDTKSSGVNPLRISRRGDAIHKPFQVPFFKTTVGVVLVIHICFLLVTLISRPYSSLMGILLTSTGIFYYYRKKIQ